MIPGHSAEPGSTRLTWAVQRTSRPPVSLLGTVTVTWLASPSPGDVLLARAGQRVRGVTPHVPRCPRPAGDSLARAPGLRRWRRDPGR